jgi:GNAT superfamily N-acetyltransferase
MITDTPEIVSRPLQSEADFWKLRNLLIETVPIIPVGFNWDVRRLDGKRFHEADLQANRLFTRPLQLWETEAGRLVGAVLPESADDAHLQVHPDYRHLEEEMIGWAETHLASPARDGGGRQLEIYTYEYDAQRHRLLSARGFEKTNEWGMIRHLRIGRQPLAQPVVPAGYTLRTTQPDDPADCQRIADLLNAAFGRDFHNAAEYRNFTLYAPCFRPDLDLVVVAPDGVFAAYVGVPYDEANRYGIFEPVCTHPAHLRRGLAQALMREGLLRLRALGAVEASVDTGNREAANRFYDSMGFTEAYRGYAWRKRFER